MKKCPYCGHVNYDDDRSCQKCYAELPSVKEAKQETAEQKETSGQKKTKRS